LSVSHEAKKLQVSICVEPHLKLFLHDSLTPSAPGGFSLVNHQT